MPIWAFRAVSPSWAHSPSVSLSWARDPQVHRTRQSGKTRVLLDLHLRFYEGRNLFLLNSRKYLYVPRMIRLEESL